MNLKALVVRQPWAWTIMEGLKAVENRSWSTAYRGPLVVVAGLSRESLPRGTEFCRGLGIAVPSDLAFGAILGVVTLRDVVAPSPGLGPFAEGPFCWLLDDPVRLGRPVPFRRGRLGLFDLPATALTGGSLAATAPSRQGALF